MRRRKFIIVTLLCLSLLAVGCFNNTPPAPPEATGTPGSSGTNKTPLVFSMKGVALNIIDDDFSALSAAGIDVITTEWGMEADINVVKAFLDKARSANLKVVLDGGFSDTAWGFVGSDWGNLPEGKRPVWQKEKVQNWVKELKDYPAVYGWDICNEYGENFPSGAGAKNSKYPETAITIEQLKQARADVLEIDPGKPILIRMNHQYFEDKFGGIDRYFESGIADIVMLNLYSNYLNNGQEQWPNVIEDIAQSDVDVLKTRDLAIKVWICLAAFEEKGIFQKPPAVDLLRDIDNTLKVNSLDGIGFFCWGPISGSDVDKIWYLPRTGANLWSVIQSTIKDYKQNQSG